jgi:Tol biopolymer transport system component
MRRLPLVAAAIVAISVGVPDIALATFPGGNGHVAFTAQCGSSQCIKILDGQSEQSIALTYGADHAHYSPSGKRLVFDREGANGCCDIYTIHADGTHRHRITHGFDDEDPAWSPNGKRIVFSREPQSGIGHLFIVNADGTHLHRLTKGSIGGSEPDWSAKGTIAFQGSSTFGSDIFVIRPDGTHVKNLTKKGGSGAPTWAPGARWIAFISGTDVWRMHADGTHKHRLTNTSSFKDHPVYSPNGKRIVYQDPVSGYNELWVMNADGSGQTQVTHDSAYDSAPTWQPT